MKTLSLGKPQPKQVQFLEDRHRYVGFGGARGGGKSWVVDNKAVRLCLRYPGIDCLIIRRTYPELYNNHIKPLTRLLRCNSTDPVADYNDSRKEIRFPNGSVIRFGYLNAERDLGRYQGSQCDVLFLDEATQIPEEWYDEMKVIVRGVNAFPKRIYITCNPGGVGHNWVKRLFVDRSYRPGENPEDYSFIQSFPSDNLALMAAQPDYLQRLESLPSRLRDAWLYGKWDIFEGQFFEDFIVTPSAERAAALGAEPRELAARHQWCHVIPAFDLAAGECRSWTCIRGYDFGYNRPFSVAWYFIDHEGVMYRALEYYGCTGEPDVGLKMTPDRQAEEVARIEREHPWLRGRTILGVADPAIWDASRGPSVAESFLRQGIYFTPGDNARTDGWMQCHYRLQFDENGRSRFYVFDRCKQFIRTLPTLVYDPRRAEDLDTDGEDHIADEWRYVCMSRPITPVKEKPAAPIWSDPLNQLI